MKGKVKRKLAKLLAFVMMFVMLPGSMMQAKAESQYAPKTELSVEGIKNKGIPVMNLEMADDSKYDALKTEKETKQDIAKFTLYNTDGTVIEKDATDKDGKKVYPLTAKGRGNSSWTMGTGKKPYNLKFDKKVDLLGMGDAKSWCLIANWVDTSYMRNYMAYNLASALGMGTPDCQQVALCINGKFEGIYLLTEKVGLNEFRTEIPKSDLDGDRNGDGVVSEIIVESDSRAYENSEPGAFTTKGGVFFVPKDPDPKDLAPNELPEIEKEVNAMEAAILSGENYKDYIDVDSWVDTYIINELAKNPDFGFGNQPCYSSSYLYFREGGKVYAGPVWDFDIAYGRNAYDNMPSEGNRKTSSPDGLFTADTKYYKELLEKTDFLEHVIRRWKELRKNKVFDTWLGSVYSDGYGAVKNLVQEDLDAWGGTDKRVAGTFDVGRKALDFEQECAYVRNFITDRIAWLDTVWNVDEIETVFSDGEWSRAKVNVKGNNHSYDDLIKDNEEVDLVWDGGYGFDENAEVTEKELGKPQGEIPGVQIDPVTLTMDTSGINGEVCARWYSETDRSDGFGGAQKEKTVTMSGTYIGLAKQASWVGNGTYTMEKNNCYVFIVTIGADGSVKVNDGSVTINNSGPCVWDVPNSDNHYGALEGKDGKYTVKYQTDGQGNHFIAGNGSAVEMKLNVVEGGNIELKVTKRADGTRYPEKLDSFEATYLMVEGGTPENWENSNPNVVAFDKNTKKVSALKAGTSTITAKSGTQSASVKFTVSEKQATELSKTEDPERGIYGLEIRRQEKPVKGTWATTESGQMYRFTYRVDLDSATLESSNSFSIMDSEKNPRLNGDGEFYIFVNGQAWLNVENPVAKSKMKMKSVFSDTIVNKGRNLIDLSDANKNLKALMQSGENTIDIFMISNEKDAYVDKLYLYGKKKIGEEAKPPVPDVPVEAITLDVEEAELNPGDTLNITAVISPELATNKKLEWSSSNPNVAKVSGSGKLNRTVTAVAPGEAVITVKAANGVSTSAKIIVVEEELPDVGEGISIIPVSRDGFDKDIIKEGVARLNAENKGLLDSDKEVVLRSKTSGITLQPNESVAFAAKDLKVEEQIFAVEGNGALTFVTPESNPVELNVSGRTLQLPKLEAKEDAYTYYLLANTGDTEVTLRNLQSEEAVEWEVSFETLPVMYRMNAQAFGLKDLEIANAKFEQASVSVFNTVKFAFETTVRAEDLYVMNRFYEDGLYGSAEKEINMLDNQVCWSGFVRPAKLTSTSFTFAVYDADRTQCENPVKLTVKVTR